jgi:hypothetical protein
MRYVARTLSVVAVAGLVSACSSATDNKTPTITLTTSGGAVNVGQGTSTTVSVFVARSRFDKPVTLTVEGAPAGVTAIVTPGTIESGIPSAALLISATASANPGAAVLTVRGNGEGITEQVVSVNLTITVTGTFSLTPLESAITVAQGGGGTVTLLIPRTGGNGGNVTLATSGAPSGLTATITPSPTTGTSSTVVLAAASGTATGTHSVTVTGSTPGLPDQTTTLSITVVSAPSTASVSIPFCADDMPAWFAYQNDGFAWQQVAPTGNAFNFAATSRVSVAFVFQSGSETEMDIFGLTRAELAASNDRDCGGSKTLTGTAAGITVGLSAQIVMGTAATTVGSFGGSAFTLQNVNARPLDLVATRGQLTGDFFGPPDKMIVRRAVDLPTGSAIPTLDFAAAEAFTPTSTNLSITGLQSADAVELQNTFWTKTSTFGTAQSAQVTGGATTLYSVPAAQLTAGDLHELFVDASQSTSSLITGRSFAVYFAAPADRTDAMGPSLSVPTVSVVTSTPYSRMRGILPSQAEYNTSARFGYFQQTSGGAVRTVVVGLSTASLGALPASWNIVTPDFTGTPGFNSSWMLAPSQPTTFFAEAFSGRTELLFGALPNQGDLVRLAYHVAPTSTASLFRSRARSAGRMLPQYLRR